MSIIYVDESGDMGMSNGSDYFIITAVKMEECDNTKYCRIPKEIRQKGLKKKTKKIAELKFSNSSVLIREMFLKRIANINLNVYSLIINKELTQQKLKDNLPILYNYLIKILLEKVLVDIDKSHKLKICLDKCMSPNQKMNFENYLKTEFFSLFNVIPDVEIVHEISYNDQGLLVTDFICGSFGYKYNTAKLKGDCDCYTNIIKDKIKVEKNDLFKKK